jgi:VCBS repeat-containing protein
MKRIFMLLALALMLGAAIALSGVAQAGTSTSTLASPTKITYVCVNKSSGQLFYLASCTNSQAKTDVSSSARTQFKACFQASNGVTRKVPESTKCSNKSTNIENMIPKVPADSTSLYFCVKSSDGTMYYKPGTSAPTCAAGQVAVVIGPHNQAPTAGNDSYSVDEDNPLNVPAPGVLANDPDPDGDTITAQLATGPSHGTLTLNSDGSFSYTPNADYNGVDSFTYKAKDSHNNLSAAAATVSITVNAVDDPPVAYDDSKTVAEDSGKTTIGVLANDTDVDGGTMQIASVGNPEHGKVVVAGDNLSLSYEPPADYCGSDSFSYTLNGGSTANVSVTVDCVNDAPVANNDSATVDAGGTVGGNVLYTNDTDVEGDALNAVLVSGPSNGTLTLNSDGSFSYTPNAGYNGTDSFTYKASDGTAYSNVATATITVNPTGADAQCKTLAIQTLGSSFNPANYTFHGGTTAGDTFTGTAGQSEVFCGFGGDDSIGTLQGGDIFLGGDGNDSVTDNNGTFYGEAGNDSVEDNSGTFNGGADNDSVTYINRSTFNGGDGNDSIVGGNFGTFNGGAGDDSVYDNVFGTFNGDAGNDHVTYNWEGGTFNGGPGDDSVTNNDFGGTATFNQD